MGRTLTVKGIGKISVKPDYTVVSISLKVLNKVYDDAMEKAGMQIEALREALCAIGFEKQDLKTTGFNVNSRYNNERDKNGNYKNVFAGFECIHQLKLEFDFDMKKLALVLSALSTSLQSSLPLKTRAPYAKSCSGMLFALPNKRQSFLLRHRESHLAI